MWQNFGAGGVGLFKAALGLKEGTFVATSLELSLYDPSGKLVKNIRASDGQSILRVVSLIQSDNHVLAGAEDGRIFVLDTLGGIVNELKVDLRITALLWVNGRLLVGTNEGLSILDRANKVQTTITQRQGLPADFVTTLLRVGNHVFVGTPKGLSIFDQNNRLINALTEKDGLADNGIVSLSQVDDRVFVGTKAGLNVLGERSSGWRVTHTIKSNKPYFHYACDAALNTLDLMHENTEVAIVITQDKPTNPVVLGVWSSLSGAKIRVRQLREEAREDNINSFAQGGTIPNPSGQEGMASVLQAISKYSGHKPDLLLLMHDGALDEEYINLESQESKKPRTFPIHFRPFGLRNKAHRTYFSKVPQPRYQDQLLPHDF